jgi:hypothetical protein
MRLQRKTLMLQGRSGEWRVLDLFLGRIWVKMKKRWWTVVGVSMLGI